MERTEKNALTKRIETFAKTNSVDEAINSVAVDMGEEFKEQSVLEGKEKKHVNKKMRKIWRNYRSNMLEKIDLENFKKFCEIEIERAKTDLELLKVKNETELVKINHWLTKNKGSLTEINYNSESKPSMFWFRLNRGLFYLKQTCSNIPKITWYTLAGFGGVALIITLAFAMSKYVF